MPKLHSSKTDIAKAAAGKAAAELVQSGMLVGLGTGSTAYFFIESLSERCRHGLNITAVATSERSQTQAAESGIPLADINTITSIDLTVDGADEIDGRNRMIKGGGGALLREKIVACMSQELVIIVDESKLVEHLGQFPLPIEIVPFAQRATIQHLIKLGYRGSLRKTKAGHIYVTDNGNHIFDIHLPQPSMNPEKDNQRIRSIPGVVETGFFFNLATRVIIGYPDGHIEIRT